MVTLLTKFGLWPAKKKVDFFHKNLTVFTKFQLGTPNENLNKNLFISLVVALIVIHSWEMERKSQGGFQTSHQRHQGHTHSSRLTSNLMAPVESPPHTPPPRLPPSLINNLCTLSLQGHRDRRLLKPWVTLLWCLRPPFLRRRVQEDFYGRAETSAWGRGGKK